MELRNLERGTLLARNCRFAVTFWERFMGLMGKKTFPSSYDGLIFEKCNSIHCFFMRMKIDVIFTDKEGRAVRCFRNLKPWRLAWGGWRSTNVIELPPGTLQASGTRPGDKLELKKQDPVPGTGR